MMRNVKLTIEYDGTGFHGWAVQPGHRTVQGVMEEALAGLVDEEVKLIVAARTDAGVHAAMQVANLKTSSTIPPERIAPAANGVLPEDTAVLESEEVTGEFDARGDCTGRAYRYTILSRRSRSPLERRQAHFVPSVLDIERMREAARALTVRHDFSSFCSSEDERAYRERTVRRLDVSAEGDLLFIDVEADSFLHNMVRIISGTLVEAGKGRFAPGDVKRILEAHDRRLAGPTLPAHGLCLIAVRYEGAG